jgi:DNA-binding transcriptional ArsR family regulator
MEDFVRRAKAIADPTRARMLKLLGERELCVCEIVDVMGLGQSTASKHLGILKAAGLVESRKCGTWSHYRLAGRDAGGFLAFVASHIGDDARVRKDRRLLAGRKPETCGR